MADRTPPLDAARSFVGRNFPQSSVAILSGSAQAGNATTTSDLDIVVIIDALDSPYRETFRDELSRWTVEAFVHNYESVVTFMDRDIARRQPSMVFMCATGDVIIDRDSKAASIRNIAQQKLEQGPPALTPEELDFRRYTLTNLVDDLVDISLGPDCFFVVSETAQAAVELFLVYHRQWTGHGKWTLRWLRRFDVARANQIESAINRWMDKEDKTEVLRFAEDTLNITGGRLLEGYRMAGKGQPN